MHQRGLPRLWVRVRHRTQMMPRMGTWMMKQREFENKPLVEQKRLLDETYPEGAKFDIVLPCWDVHGGRGYAKHCGLHTEIMHACGNSEVFAKHMKSCLEQSQKLWAKGHHCVRVVCVCNQGRHRSVCVSAILQAVHSEMGFNSKGPNHLSHNSWWKKMCTTCSDCRPNRKKAELFRRLADDYAKVA